MKKVLSVCLLSFVFILTSQAKALDAIANNQDLNSFTSNYYKEHRTDLVGSALKFIDGSNIMLNKRAEAPLIAFFNRIFHDNPTKNEAWSQVLKTVKLPVRVAFLKSMNLSEAELLAEQPMGPIKNDMFWAFYFASGDLGYVKKIVDLLDYYDQDKELDRFLAAGAAKWSLSINAHHNADVEKYLKTILNEKKSPHAGAIEEILSSDPKTIHAEVMKKANSNKAKGLW